MKGNLIGLTLSLGDKENDFFFGGAISLSNFLAFMALQFTRVVYGRKTDVKTF